MAHLCHPAFDYMDLHRSNGILQQVPPIPTTVWIIRCSCRWSGYYYRRRSYAEEPRIELICMVGLGK